jgi:hypothetical protein
MCAHYYPFMRVLTPTNLQSTVMLTANVSFLAIPGVVIIPQNTGPSNAWINPSPAQITSSISLVFSIGSIITGLLVIRRHRNMMTKDPRSAVGSNLLTSHSELMGFPSQWHDIGYEKSWSAQAVGLEPLAIAFSLTYTLLMWSYVIFKCSAL